MSPIEKTARIVSIRRGVGERVYLDLEVVEPSPMPPRMPKPEEVIEPMPKSDTEKVAREVARATVEEFRRAGMPTVPSQVRAQISAPSRFSVSLSKEEYEKLGKPTVYDELKLTIEVKDV